MTSIAWTPGLTVGVEEIDNQHRDLFRNVNRFFEQVRDGNGNLANLFSFLETYVKTHFALEEKYMSKFHVNGEAYEDEKTHRAEHRAFLRDFSAYREEFLENGATPLLVDEFQKWITNWMSGHIGKTDKGLGRFLQSALPFLKRN